MECQRGLATRKLKAVDPSVCPSVKRVDCDKTEERSVQILYHTKEHLAQFSDKKNGWWGATLLPESLGKADPVGAESPIFSRYSPVAPQR